MEKYILRVDNDNINAITESIETKVIPVVAKILTKLTELGITSNVKQCVIEAFSGRYSRITELYREQLEKDASTFTAKSVKESLLNQLNGTISDFKDFVADTIFTIGFDEFDRLKLNSPAILEYIDLDKKGNPVMTKENKEAIKERFTTYVTTELGAEFHKKHIAAVKALDDLYKFCDKIHYILPGIPYNHFYERERETGSIRANILNYDFEIECRKPTEQEEPESGPIVVPRQKDSILDLSSKNKKSIKTIKTC